MGERLQRYGDALHSGMRKTLAIGATAAALSFIPSDRDQVEPITYVADPESFADDSLRVITANVLSLEKLAGGDNVEGTLEMVDKWRPTVFCTSEQPYDQEFFDAMKERYYSFIFDPTRKLPGHELFGNAVFVRGMGIELVSSIELPVNFYDETIKMQPRNTLHARFRKADGKYISVFSTHLSNDESDRWHQMEVIRDEIKSLDNKETDAYMLCMDANANHEELVNSPLAEVFDIIPTPDTYPANKFYYPSLEPIIPDQDIDKIFVSALNPECRISAVSETGREHGFFTDNFDVDHLLLGADFDFEDCLREIKPDIA